MKKADYIREKRVFIADRRLSGWTWGEIAAALDDDGIHVSADELRSYWPRISRGRDPREVLLVEGHRLWARTHDAEVAQLAAEKECATLRDRVTALENQEEEVERLRRRVADLEKDLAAIDVMSLGVGKK